MFKDKQNIESIYTYFDTNYSKETEELKVALKTVLLEQKKEISVKIILEVVVDMTDIDLSLVLMTKENISETIEVVKRCYKNTKEVDKSLFYCLDCVDEFCKCVWYNSSYKIALWEGKIKWRIEIKPFLISYKQGPMKMKKL